MRCRRLVAESASKGRQFLLRAAPHSRPVLARLGGLQQQDARARLFWGVPAQPVCRYAAHHARQAACHATATQQAPAAGAPGVDSEVSC